MSRVWPMTKADRAHGLRARAIVPPSWDDGFAAGVAHGRATVETELVSDRAALAALIGSLELLGAPSKMQFAVPIEEIAARLAMAAAGTSAIDRDLLAARALAAAAMLADELPVTRLCFHPADLALIDGDALPCPVAAASDLARGSVRAEAGDAWAADGVREAIARIVAAVGL